MPWSRKAFGALVLTAALSGRIAEGQVRIEYVAHSCFVVESPGGVRALVDPFNGTRWLGYSFPAPIAADVVLVTHPHYDHDASYYASGHAPVLRRPGEYAVGDLRILGVEGRHAEPWGEEFGGVNTLWVLEVGGLRIAHLGDTGLLSAESLRALGRVDVLMLPVDDQDHILKRSEIAAIREALQPRVTVPMHYRLAEVTSLPESLGTIDKWLLEQPEVVRLGTHETVLERLPAKPQVMVFSRSPRVAPWAPELREAWTHRHRAREGPKTPEGREQAIADLRRAVVLAPQCMVFSVELGRALVESGRNEEAVAVLEPALAAAGGDDWEYTLRARDLLADLYARRGDAVRAALQYRLVQRDAYQRELRERAEAFLGAASGVSRR
jgi:L-ascorbate metabolism protein UlaG (beta-lactamase superfamily)